jgi:exportin-T
MEHMQRIFTIVSVKMRFPLWYNFDQMDHAEQKFDRFRRVLVSLFTNQVHVAPEFIVECVHSVLQQTIGAPKNGAAIEAVLHLLYRLGEGLSSSEKLQQGALRMLASVVKSEVSRFPHPRVSLAYFDVCERYSAFVVLHPESLPRIVMSFMDARGFYHEHPTVRSHSCYQLLQFVSSLPDEFLPRLAPLMDQMLAIIKKLIGSVLGRALKPTQQVTISYDSCIHLCELIGKLVSSSVTGAKCAQYALPVFDFFREQLEAGLKQMQSSTSSSSSSPPSFDPLVVGQQFSEIVNAIAAISKPLTADMPVLANGMGKCLQSVVTVLKLLPAHEDVRKSVVFFIHRLVACLGDGLLPCLPQFIELLLPSTDATSIVAFLQLMSRFVMRFGVKFGSILDVYLLPTVQKVFEILKTWAHIGAADATPHSAYSAERAQRLDLHKTYYALLRNIVMHSCSSVLTSQRNVKHTRRLLDTVLQGCTPPGIQDAGIHKTCFYIIEQLAVFFHSESKQQEQLPHALQQFVFCDATRKIFECALHKSFDFKDIGYIACAQQMLKTQTSIYQMYPKAYGAFCGEFLVKSLGVQRAFAQNYLEHMHRNAAKPFRKLFIQLCSQLSLADNTTTNSTTTSITTL